MPREIYRIDGADSEHFLQGLVTNDVAKLSRGLVYTAMLTPQGKYLADFFLVPAEGAILLDVDANIGASLVQRLGMYKLRADVNIGKTALHLHRGLGTPPQDAFADPRSEALGWRAYREDAQPEDQHTDWDAVRVGNLIPETGTDLTNDSYILEMGFERLNGVDFKKGCYVGQEVTARMKHKTELRKGLVQVTGTSSLTAGSEITSKGKPVGSILTTSGDKALAYLRFDRATGELEADGVTLTRTA
ncbi:folate-binding protein [Lentibacter algarum]|uniref:CAF17-like 4Fe-4S cluster assembly/insertion protein YgfZ n=1 Tax=Lentibacter algarum TaxID=576131 RepID=UPI001C065F5D|nr:folate-binding protein [Lentibacter algarum]MBU2981972.1 folate-binding protein [Lentibacter algarum]